MEGVIICDERSIPLVASAETRKQQTKVSVVHALVERGRFHHGERGMPFEE